MKAFIIFLSLTMVASFTYAQSLDDTQQHVRIKMAEDTAFSIISEGLNKNGLYELNYKSNYGIKNFFFCDDGLCCVITFLYKKKDLPAIVSLYDSLPRYIKIADLQWFDSKDRMNITITAKNDNPLFQIKYTKP